MTEDTRTSPYNPILDFRPPPLLVGGQIDAALPSVSPVAFYEKHICPSLLLKRVLPLPDLPGTLKDLAHRVLQAEAEQSLERGPDIALHPGEQVDPINKLEDLANLLWRRDLLPALCLTSTCLLEPNCPIWKTVLGFHLERTDPKAFSSASFGVQVRDSARRPHQSSSSSITMTNLHTHTPWLATWQLFVPLKEASSMLTNVSYTDSFKWKTSSTQAPACPQSPSRHPDPDAVMPWSDTIKRQQSERYASRVLRSRSSTSRDKVEIVKLGRRPKARAYKPVWPDYIQQLWSQAIEHDTTLVVMHCGTYQRIGIRDRQKQTLYLSEPIETENNEDYTRIQLGLHMGAVQDAILRLPILKAQSTKQPLKRKSESSSDPNDRTNKKRKVKLAASLISQQDLVTRLATCDFFLMHLHFHIYASSTPSAFLREPSLDVNDPRRKVRLKTMYPLDKCLQLSVSSKLGSGATGDVFLADARLGQEEKTVVQVVVKFAFTDEQQKRLAHERRIYNRFAERPCSYVPRCFGLFTSRDQDAMALIIEYCGTPIRRISRFAHPDPSDNHRVLVKPPLREKFMEALKQVHASGVIHRDIRPPNLLLLEGTDEPRIIDFDRARLDRSESQQNRELRRLEEVLDGLVAEHDSRRFSSRSTPGTEELKALETPPEEDKLDEEAIRKAEEEYEALKKRRRLRAMLEPED